MQITILGANGRVGSLVVEQALKQGHTVVAFVHRKSRLPENPHLKTAKGDIYDAETIKEAIEGSDLVISTLSSWGTRRKDVLTAAMQNLLPVMQKAKVPRIISLTGADARAAGDVLTPLHQLSHTMLRYTPSLRKILSDGERHIELLEASGLDWTVVRSPIMNTRGEAAHFRLAGRRPLPWATINRQSVAQSLVNLIGDDSYSRQAPYIVRT